MYNAIEVYILTTNRPVDVKNITILLMNKIAKEVPWYRVTY